MPDPESSDHVGDCDGVTDGVGELVGVVDGVCEFDGVVVGVGEFVGVAEFDGVVDGVAEFDGVAVGVTAMEELVGDGVADTGNDDAEAVVVGAGESPSWMAGAAIPVMAGNNAKPAMVLRASLRSIPPGPVTDSGAV